MSEESIKAIIARIINNADEAVKESREDREDHFKSGRSLAYYEILDILRTEIDAAGGNIEDYGVDVNLEEKYI